MNSGQRSTPPQSRACHASWHTAQAALMGGQGIVRLLVGAVRLIAWVASGAVDVDKAAGRPAAAVFGDGLVGYRLAYPAIPALPLDGGVWWAVHVEQRLPAERAD